MAIREENLKNSFLKRRKSLALAIFSALIVTVPALSVQDAFAHGGMQAPPADLAGKKVTMFVKLEPTVVTDVNQPVFISARVYDENTNENLEQVSYRIYFKKDGQLIRSSDQIFYDAQGDLQIKLVPKDIEVAQVKGQEEPFFGGKYNQDGGPVLMEGRVFTEPGLYNLFIEIVTAGTAKNLVDPPLQYDIWVTPGREEMIPVETLEGQTYEVKVRNYYGAIEESTYDKDSKTIQFSMPFEWEGDFVSRIGMLHTEMFIPKGLADFDKSALYGSVNGISVPVLVDQVSDPEQVVVHFTVSQKNLISIANAIGNDTSASKDMAVFSIRPPASDEEIIPAVENVGYTDNYKVALTWPSEILPGRPVTFGIRVSDKSGDVIPNAAYELVIMKGEQVIERKGGVTTPEGIGSQDVSFDAGGPFTIKVEKVNSSPESVSMALQVVPEFGAVAYVILALTVGAVVFASRASLAKRGLGGL